jgi:hypothetical protein
MHKPNPVREPRLIPVWAVELPYRPRGVALSAARIRAVVGNPRSDWLRLELG